MTLSVGSSIVLYLEDDYPGARFDTGRFGVLRCGRQRQQL